MKSFISVALVVVFAVAVSANGFGYGGFGGFGHGGLSGYGNSPVIAASPNYLTHANSIVSGSVSGPVRGGFYSGFLGGHGGLGGFDGIRKGGFY